MESISCIHSGENGYKKLEASSYGTWTVNSMNMTFQLGNFGKYKSTRFKYEKKTMIEMMDLV